MIAAVRGRWEVKHGYRRKIDTNAWHKEKGAREVKHGHQCLLVTATERSQSALVDVNHSCRVSQMRPAALREITNELGGLAAVDHK